MVNSGLKEIVHVVLVEIEATAIHQVKVSAYKSERISSVDTVFLEPSYTKYFLFLSTMRRFVALVMRVRDTLNLHKVVSSARFLLLFKKQFVYPA